MTFPSKCRDCEQFREIAIADGVRGVAYNCMAFKLPRKGHAKACRSTHAIKRDAS